MESKVWVINDPDIKEPKPKSKPIRIYLIVMIVLLIVTGGYFVYGYLLASGNEAVIDKVLNAQNSNVVKAVQGKKHSSALSKPYLAEDIEVTNKKLLTWSDVDRKVRQMSADSNGSLEGYGSCPDGYETVIVERIYAQETYCYGQKKSFLLQKKAIAGNVYTVTDYIFDKNRKTDPFRQNVDQYLLNGKKISK